VKEMTWLCEQLVSELLAQYELLADAQTAARPASDEATEPERAPWFRWWPRRS
jgi:hypothetical protein